MSRADGDKQTTALPAPLEASLADWANRIAQIEATERPDRDATNLLKRQLGLDIVSALDSLGDEAAITPLMEELAERLGKSRTFIYQMTNVARAFPEGDLPVQPWSTLIALASLSPQQRRHVLDHITDNTPCRHIPKPKPEASGSGDSEGQQWQARGTLVIMRAFAGIHPSEKVGIIADLLDRLDPATLAAAGPKVSLYYLNHVVGAAQKHIASLSGPAAGPIHMGRDDEHGST